MDGEITGASSQDVLTRKKVLKRAAAGAAVVWVAPLVLTDVASASVDIKGSVFRCLALSRNGSPCGHGCFGSTTCSSDACCQCVVLTNGCCDCVDGCEQQGCGNPPCAKNKDCPRGFRCIDTSCCGGAPGRCFPVCERPFGAPSDARAGSTLVGA